MKKLIPAVVMLLISAVVLSTASYAWFTTTQSATASGMQVTATAPSSVLIRQIDATGNSTTEFGSAVTFTGEAVTLTPASTVNGVDFFAPTRTEDALGGMAWDADIEEVENGGDTYYVDYLVEVQNAGSETITLSLTKLNITGPAIKDAVRVAILAYSYDDASQEWVAEQINTNTPYLAYDNANDGYVRYPTSEDAYGDSEGPLYGENDDKGGQTMTPSNADTVIATLDPDTAEATNPNTIMLAIRVYIEGQSEVCISRNANSDTAVSINLAFAKTGVTAD